MMAGQVSLDDVQDTGLSAATKLRRTRIIAIDTPTKETTDKTGVEPKECLQRLRQARNLTRVDWITGKELYERRKDRVQSNPSQGFRDASLPKSKEYFIITEKVIEDAPRRD